MNFATLFRALDTLVVLRDTAKRLKGPSAAAQPPPDASLTAQAPGIAGHIEARLTNVVVAALKEAFDRDHARLELERAQIENERRRAEEALRLELRRQSADREVGRLRLLAGTALVGWIASVLLFVVRLGDASLISRGIVAAGWVLLLAALGASFRAQGRISALLPAGDGSADAGGAADLPMWLLVAGLALSAASLLF